MNEHSQIVTRWRQGQASILATLVRIQGSSYRQPGARLLIVGDGSYVGGVSAGCLEGSLLRKAGWLVRNGAAIERYSTLFDEASEMPFGLGCGGVLDVLLEPVDTPECQALLQAMEATLAGHEHLVATWIPAEGHSLLRAIFPENGPAVFASSGLSPESLAQAGMHRFHKAETQSPLPFAGVFFERLVTPQRLFVFGAGDDAKPLVAMASLLGWSVIVVDGRSNLASPQRFAHTDVTVASAPAQALRRIHARDAVVLMTHSYEQDREYLAALLPLRPRYLGLLGSRQRSSLLIAHAAASLDWSVPECCERISAPIGLNIGGEGPEAIALAILAEAQACCAGKLKHFRKLSVELVEHYLANEDAQPSMQAQCDLDRM